MKKRGQNLKVASNQDCGTGSKVKRSLVNSPSRSLAASQSAPGEQFTQQEQPQGKQVYDSEEGALEVLVESIVGKLGDSPRERREMADFLNMLLETDPTLRHEVLSGVVVRK
jgi:hypothetical protein